MGFLSCFGSKSDSDRNVHSAPATLERSSPKNGTREQASPGRRCLSAPENGERTDSKNDSKKMKNIVSNAPPPSAEEIPEEILNQGEFSVSEIFGETVIRNLSSEEWSEREDALNSIRERIEKEQEQRQDISTDDDMMMNKLPLFNACCCILRPGLCDKIAPVYFAAISLLETLAVSFAVKINNDDAESGLSGLMSIVVNKVGDSNVRILEASCQAIIAISRCSSSLGGLDFTSPFILRPITNMKRLRLVWGRLELLKRTMECFEIRHSNAFVLDTILPFVVPALGQQEQGNNLQGKVRKLAQRIVSSVYKQSSLLDKAKVRQHLETCPSATLKALNRRFDIIDGKDPAEREAREKKLNGRVPLRSLPPINNFKSSLPPLKMEKTELSVKSTSLNYSQKLPSKRPIPANTDMNSSVFNDDEENFMNDIICD